MLRCRVAAPHGVNGHIKIMIVQFVVITLIIIVLPPITIPTNCIQSLSSNHFLLYLQHNHVVFPVRRHTAMWSSRMRRSRVAQLPRTHVNAASSYWDRHDECATMDNGFPRASHFVVSCWLNYILIFFIFFHNFGARLEGDEQRAWTNVIYKLSGKCIEASSVTQASPCRMSIIQNRE